MCAVWITALALATTPSSVCRSDPYFMEAGSLITCSILSSSDDLMITEVELNLEAMYRSCMSASVDVTYTATGETKSKGFATAPKVKNTTWNVFLPVNTLATFEIENESSCAITLIPRMLYYVVTYSASTTSPSLTSTDTTSSASTSTASTSTAHMSTASTSTASTSTASTSTASTSTASTSTASTSTAHMSTASTSTAHTSAASTSTASTSTAHMSTANTSTANTNTASTSTAHTSTASTSSMSIATTAISTSQSEEVTEMENETLRELICQQAAVTSLVAGLSGAATGPALRLIVVARGCSRNDQYIEVLSPLGWVIDGSRPLGAMLGNMTVVAAVFVGSFFIATTAYCAGTAMVPAYFAVHDTRAMIRVPSVAIVVCLVLFPGCVLAAVDLALHTRPGEEPLKWLLGCAGIIMCACVPIAIRHALQRYVPQGVSVVTDPVRRHPVTLFMLSQEEWVSHARNPHVAERYASILRPYRQPTAWFAAADFAGSFVVAAVAAVAPEDRVACGHVHTALASVFLILLCMDLWYQPYLHTRNTVLNVLVLAGLVTSMGLQGAAYYQDTDGEQLSLQLMYGVGIVLMVRVGFDVLGAVYVVCQGSRTRLQEEQWEKQWTCNPPRDEDLCDDPLTTPRSLQSMHGIPAFVTTHGAEYSAGQGGPMFRMESPLLTSPQACTPDSSSEPEGGPMVRRTALSMHPYDVARPSSTGAALLHTQSPEEGVLALSLKSQCPSLHATYAPIRTSLNSPPAAHPALRGLLKHQPTLKGMPSAMDGDMSATCRTGESGLAPPKRSGILRSMQSLGVEHGVADFLDEL